jgi:AcrR family transcriptional regulator
MRKKQSRSTHTIQSVLHAAIDAARECGWEKTSVKAICERAGVSVGAFYHHFHSKQDLVNRSFLLFDETIDDSFDQDRPTDKNCANPRAALKNILLRQTQFVVTEAGPLIKEYYLNILNDPARSAVDPERKYYQAVFLYNESAARHLHPDLNPKEATEILIKYVRGCIIDCAFITIAMTWLTGSTRSWT